MLVYCCDYYENHSVQFEEGLDLLLSSSLFFILNKGLLNLRTKSTSKYMFRRV